jgi:hypothetical protein
MLAHQHTSGNAEGKPSQYRGKNTKETIFALLLLHYNFNAVICNVVLPLVLRCQHVVGIPMTCDNAQ